MNDPWTLFWRSNNPQSCIPTSSNASVPALTQLWASFAASLPPACSVLDLATGNGIVPYQLLGARDDLQITAADRAAIDPLHSLHEPAGLCRVQFRPSIDLADPAMRLGAFGAVTSQFGIEYLPAQARVAAVERHLAPGGRFCLVVHHSASAIVTPRAADLRELDTLLDEGGPAQAAQRFARQQLDAASLERQTHAFMQRELRRTQRLSGRVVQGVDRLLTVLETGDAAGARQLARDLAIRVAAERERLTQLQSAALDASGAAAFTAALRAAGLNCDAHSVITDTVSARDAEPQAHEVILGWRFTGQRLSPAAGSSV
jgi:SAM-dependent methyltransferase